MGDLSVLTADSTSAIAIVPTLAIVASIAALDLADAAAISASIFDFSACTSLAALARAAEISASFSACGTGRGRAGHRQLVLCARDASKATAFCVLRACVFGLEFEREVWWAGAG